MKMKKNLILNREFYMRYYKTGFIQGLLTILIIILGIIGAVIFIKYKKQPEKVEQPVLAPLVKVLQINSQDIPITIQGYGASQPKVQLDIIPEVAGKVVYIHPELKVGGFISADEKILQIDPRDYELALSQAQASVENAKELLEKELAEAQVARNEWMQLHGDTEPDSALVLREPQIRKAESALKSAQAQLATAELRLERTVLTLDFDVLITNENVDLGQYVVTGQSLAKAYGTEAIEIVVPLEDKELEWFDAFGNSTNTNRQKTFKEPEVIVKANFAGEEQTWQGKVVRTTGQVDRTSRMISVIIEVKNPFEVSEGKAPLLPGIFAEVLIQGKTLHNALAIPREAIHEGNEIWIANNNKLHIKTLDIIRQDKQYVYIASQPDTKLTIVTSSLDVVTDQMNIRTEFGTAATESNINDDSKSDSEEN